MRGTILKIEIYIKVKNQKKVLLLVSNTMNCFPNRFEHF